MQKLDLFGKSTKVGFLTDDLCHKVEKALLEGEHHEISFVHMESDVEQTATFVSHDATTRWALRCTRKELRVEESALKFRGTGTYSKVMSLLMQAATKAGACVVVEDVEDPGLQAWCEQRGFVKQNGSLDYRYDLISQGR